MSQDAQEPATLTMWLGPDDQAMYQALKDGLTVDDSLSGEAKRRVRDGLVVREVLRSRDLSFSSRREREAWIRSALVSYERDRD